MIFLIYKIFIIINQDNEWVFDIDTRMMHRVFNYGHLELKKN